MFTRAALLVVLMLACGCGWPFGGPDRWANGTWEALGSDSRLVRLTLQQDGDTISGTACALIVSIPDRLTIEFEDVSVTGDYPSVFFRAPSGSSFSGRYDEDRDEIAGNFGASALRFTRIQQGLCALR